MCMWIRSFQGACGCPCGGGWCLQGSEVSKLFVHVSFGVT